MRVQSRVKAIVLAAPDIDAAIFKEQIAPKLAAWQAPVTVYASRRDKALIASKEFWGHERAGHDAAALAGLPGIEAIDSTSAVTDYLHHGYFGDSTRLLHDLNLVFEGVPADDARRGSYLSPKTNADGKRYWMLKGPK